MIESLCLYPLCLSAALLFYTGFQNYSLIRSTSCSCFTCCLGLGFQLQNLQDFIKISRALIKDIFLPRPTADNRVLPAVGYAAARAALRYGVPQGWVQDDPTRSSVNIQEAVDQVATADQRRGPSWSPQGWY